MSDLVALLRDALSTVEDPDLHKDLVTLNMVRDLAVNDGTAVFTLVLTTSACPMKKQIEDDCRQAALSVDGINEVDMTTTAETPKKCLWR